MPIRRVVRSWLRNERLVSFVQVICIALSLSIGISAGTLVVAWTAHKGQIAAIHAQYASEFSRLQEAHQSQLEDKDATIKDKDAMLTSILERLDALAGKTERAATVANTAATKVDKAAETIERATSTPPEPKPAPPRSLPEFREHP